MPSKNNRKNIAVQAAFLSLTAFSVLTTCKSPLLNMVLEEVAVAVTPPVISAVYPSASSQEVPVNAEFSITFSKNINASTVNSASLPITDAAGAIVGGNYTVNAATITFKATGGLQYGAVYMATVTGKVLDTDGNSLTEDYFWTFTTSLTPDTNAPSINSITFASEDIILVDTAKWSGSLTVQATLDALDDRAIAQVMLSENSSMSGATWITYNPSNPVYAYTFSAPGGSKHLYGKVKDGAGNVSETGVSEDIKIDITNPEITNFLINNGASATNSNSVNLSIISADKEEASGVSEFRYRFAGGEWQAWQALTLESGTGVGNLSGIMISTSLGETAVVEAQVIDKVNHQSAVFQQSILFEQTPPTIVDVSWDGASVFPYNGSLLRIIFDEEMNPPSITADNFKLLRVSDSSTVSGMINLTTGNSIPNAAAELWGLELAPNTSYKVVLGSTVQDRAGNDLGGSNRNWFFSTGDATDDTPPSGPITLTDYDAADPVIKVVTLPSGSMATNNAIIELNFSAVTDDYNIPYGIKIWGDNDGTLGEKSFEQDASWIPWTNSLSWNLSVASGTKYVLVKLMDSAGNQSLSPIQLKFILDNGELPAISAVSINGGQTHTNATNRKVSVNINASDTYSGLKEMMISQSDLFTGASWQAWEPLIEDWILPTAEVSHIFYVKVRDYLDQESTTNSAAAIILDTTDPVVSFNTQQILVSSETCLLEGLTGSDFYQISEPLSAYTWEQLSGPGSIYFNAATGGGTANDGEGIQEPYAVATVEGNYYIKLTVWDNAGNSGEAVVPFTWDVTDPGNVSNLSVSGYDTTGQPTWTWAAVSDADFYRTSFASNFSSYIDVTTNTFTPNSPLTPDGTKTLYVRAQDNAGNSSAELSASVRVDTTKPTITVTNNSFIANAATPTITINYTGVDGSVTDGGTNPSGIASYSWSRVSGAGTVSFNPPPETASTTVSATVNGVYHLRLRVTDLAGNITDAYMSLLRDTTLPNTPAVTGATLTPSLRPTWYWSSNGGGIGTFQYKLVNTTNSITIVDWTTTLATSYKPTVDLTNLKTYTMYVQEIDAANNWSTSGSIATAVNIAAITPAQITIGDADPALRTVNTIEWDLLTGCGGAANSYRYDIDNTGTWTTIGSALPDVTPVKITRNSLSNGTHTIVVQEQIDTTWRTDIQASHSIIVDMVPPSAPTLTGTGLTTVDSDRTATTDTTPTWIWSTGGGGNGKYMYQFTRTKNADGSADGNVLIPWTAETTATGYTPAVVSNGTYQIEVRERDDAGNLSAVSYKRVTVDTVAPILTSVTLRDPTPFTEDTDNSHSNSATIMVDLVGNIASEPNPVTLKYLDYNPVTAYETYGSAFEADGTMTISTTVTSGDGTKYVYAQLVDEAGNGSAYRNDTIVVDTTAPTGTFTINNGAATTPSLAYKLTLSMADNLTTSASLLVSNYDYYNSAGGGSIWGPYRAYATVLSSDYQFSTTAGTKYGYVRIYDEAGNYTQIYDSITLEVPVPIYANKGTYPSGYTYVYYDPVTDPAGGSASTIYYVYSTSVANANPNTGAPVTYEYSTTSVSSCYAPIPKGELLYFFVRAYDADTGGYGPYSATSVLGFSSNVTVVYDDDEPADVTRASQIKLLLEDTSIVDNVSIFGIMPTWTVTLLPEDLISNTYNATTPAINQIYGDPVILTSGTSFSTLTTYDGIVRNIASSGKGTIAMGYGGAYFLYRVDQNWTTWNLASVSLAQPSDIDSGNQMVLLANRTAKTRPIATSDSIWYTPLYYNVLYNSYQNTSITTNIFITGTGDVDRRGVYISSGTNPTNGAIYAGDTYSDLYFPVVRQGEYCYFGYYEVPDYSYTGKVFLINVVAKMDNY